MVRRTLASIFVTLPVIVLGLFILGSSAYARNQTGKGQPESSPAAPEVSGKQAFADVAYDAESDKYLVVWTDTRTDPNLADIYGQWLNEDGTPIGPNIAIASDASSQSEPAVAFGGDTFLVVWTGYEQGNADIYGRFLRSDGSVAVNSIYIAGYAEDERLSDVAYSASTGAFVVAFSYEASDNSYDIYGQVVKTDAQLEGSRFAIATTSDSEVAPEIAYNFLDATYLVAWHTYGATSTTIQARRFSGFSTAQGGVINVYGPYNNVGAPSVVYHQPQNSWFIVWEQAQPTVADASKGSPDGGPAGTDFNILGRRVLANGNLGSEEVSVISAAPRDQGDPAIAVQNNRFLVTWTDNRDGNHRIRGRHVTPLGLPYGAEFVISSGPLKHHSSAVAPNFGDNESLVVWNDFHYTNDADQDDVYGQRVGESSLVEGRILIAPLPYNVPTPCPIEYSDVPQGSTFHSHVNCLACRNIISGYGDGTFKPGNNITRAQLAKIVSNAAGYDFEPGEQLFEDIPADNGFYPFIGRLALQGIIGGYACGGPGEPCVAPGNRPYFRPSATATRGQISKIVALASDTLESQTRRFQDVPPENAFYGYVNGLVHAEVMSGYACGGPGEPCVTPGNLPYFRVGSNATRGQVAKIVANTFFPECQVAANQ